MKKKYFLFAVFTVVFMKLGFSQTPIYVKGKLIEIYTAAPNKPVYPKPVKDGPDDFFDATIPSEINGREFATSMPEFGVGPIQVSGDAGRYVIAAVHHKDFNTAGWVDLNVSFTMRDDATPRNTYYLFRLDITETGKWYDIPQQTSGTAPTLLFADQGDVKWVDFNPISGVVIAEKAASSNLIADPSICVLPNGNLMALAKGPLPKRQFRSTDGGLTWQGFGPDYIQIRFATPFTHNGVLYMLSSFDPGSTPGIFIRKSLDNGETWETYNGKNYVLLNDTVLNGALNTPSPVVISNGRIWRAFGDNGPDDFPNLGLMSAPVDADLMNPSSWTYTNTIVRASSIGRYGGILKPWEPCAVATRDGYPVIFSRTEPSDPRNGDSSPMYRSTSESNLTFTQSDVIDFPGAKEKFCIQYDQISDTYWALANPAYIEDIGAGDNIRSSRKTLVLQSSKDLINWKVESVIAQGTDQRFHGYQYPYFIIAGNDILAAVRTAAEYEDGQAVRQHDANFITFNRIKNFRDFLTKPEVVRIRKGWDVIFMDGRNTSSGDAPKLYSTPIAESNQWVQVDLGNGYFAYKKSGTDLVLEGGNAGEQIKLMPFNSNNENQQWKKIKADVRHFFLEKRNAPGFVIDGGSSGNGQVLTLAANVTSNLNQRWEFEVVPGEFNVGKPTASFEQPTSNVKLAVGSNVNAIVNANDSNGTITKVDLFLNDVFVSSDTEAPFQWDGNHSLLQNITPGNYTLKAIATDNDGEQVATTTTFQVGEEPTVSFVQPIQNERFDVGSNIDVIVNANDSNGTIVKVDLLLDDSLVGTDIEAPFQWETNFPLLQNMAKGHYTLQAIATDNDGQQAITTTTFIVGGDASDIGVNVVGTGYTKKTFDNGALLWNNRTYTLQDVPTDFIGFEFLQSAAQIAEGGTITPLKDGFVYLIAREPDASKLGTGWTVVPNTGFNYNNAGVLTSLVIFQHEAIADTPITIPLASGFTGVTPIAKNIRQDNLLDDDNDGVNNALDSCANTPVGESVNTSGCSQSQLDDDNDGVKNTLDSCPNTPIGESVNTSGCSQSQLDDDNDGVNNALDSCPNTPVGSSVDQHGCIYLAANNFSIEVIGETCPDTNNGQINITAIKDLVYTARVNGVSYPFTGLKLNLQNLAPSTYDICILVTGTNLEQCYSVNIPESTAITGKIVSEKDKLFVEIQSGTAPYQIALNGITQFETNDTNFHISFKTGDLLEVTTVKDCEGVFSKTITLSNEIKAAPNPTSGQFDLYLSTNEHKVKIEIYNEGGGLISKSNYPIENGRVHLNLEKEPTGVYFVNIQSDPIETIKIIKK